MAARTGHTGRKIELTPARAQRVLELTEERIAKLTKQLKEDRRTVEKMRAYLAVVEES